MGQKIDIFGDNEESVKAARRDVMQRALAAGRRAHAYIIYKNRDGKWTTSIDFCSKCGQKQRLNIAELSVKIAAKHRVTVKW